MKAAVDSSVLVAALDVHQEHHAQCFDLLDLPGLTMLSHAVSECFSSLTGGRSGRRAPASLVTQALAASILPAVKSCVLDAQEIVVALETAEKRGVRGGAVYDFLHLVAAKKSGAERLYTLDVSDFMAFRRHGDPDIVHPVNVGDPL
ncbi:PIN domain-containing protein [Prosthecobacter sp.]|uniref:PIN domain-containing protein n=1 Tax=Prosthecobacter sp. TaxID=1965333 RepID=UPI003784083D